MTTERPGPAAGLTEYLRATSAVPMTFGMTASWVQEFLAHQTRLTNRVFEIAASLAGPAAWPNSPSGVGARLVDLAHRGADIAVEAIDGYAGLARRVTAESHALLVKQLRIATA